MWERPQQSSHAAHPRDNQDSVREAAEKDNGTDMLFLQTLAKNEQILSSDRDNQRGRKRKSGKKADNERYHSAFLRNTVNEGKLDFLILLKQFFIDVGL
ncbi:hypothetical protein [Acetobacter senegalensis]|uniref:hypothetical protein n=1 Tax=Acetobacter senegalensis TaxID=446692 RepID=UPI00200FE9EF|nr:hypothetical protein [Acetobacter senegalensis]